MDKTMRKTIVILSIFFSILVLVSSSPSAEVTPEFAKWKWLFGTWLGVLEGTREKTRSMEVKDIVVSSDGHIRANALYGTTDGKMQPIRISLISESGFRLSFETPAKPPSKIDVTRITASRLDGTFKRDNRERSIRFWKLEDRSFDPKLSIFLGDWEGIWSSNVPARLTIEHIDLTAASVRYEWGSHDVDDEYGRKFGPGWIRANARITSEQKLEFESLDRSYRFVFELTSDHKYLDGGLVSGSNRIRMKRAQPR
jgi:hypothetical protein